MSDVLFYIAGIVKEPNASGYTVYFPDIPSIAAWGTTIEETLVSAGECLAETLKDLSEKNQPIPHPSDISSVREQVKAEREGDGFVYTDTDTLYQYFQAPNLDMVPVQVTISIPKNILYTIDKKARMAGMTRSAFMTMASNAYTA